MEKKIGKIVKHAGIKAGDAMSKAKDVVVQAVDQNGDGKVDLQDAVSALSGNGKSKKGGLGGLLGGLFYWLRKRKFTN